MTLSSRRLRYTNDGLVVRVINDHNLIDWENQDDKILAPFALQINSALGNDDYKSLEELFRQEKDSGTLQKAGYVFSPSLLMTWAIELRALRCAECMLSGATGHFVDLNAAPSSRLLTPIHLAVLENLPEFVELFIRHGVQLDMPRETYMPFCYMMLLPLDLGIRTLRKKIVWTLDQTIFELTSSLPLTVDHAKKQALCCISHLIRKTPIVKILEVINQYVQGGQIVELAILLYVDAMCGCGSLKSLSANDFSQLCDSVAANVLLCPEGKLDLVFSADWVTSSTLEDQMTSLVASMMALLKFFHQQENSLPGNGTSRQISGKRNSKVGFDLTDDYFKEAFKNGDFGAHKEPADGDSSNGPLVDDPFLYMNSIYAGKTEEEDVEDGMIISCVYDLSIEKEQDALLKLDDVLPYRNQILSALTKDEVQQLIKVVRDREKLVFEQRNGYLIHPSLILKWAVAQRAIKCAQSMLSGCLDQIVDVREIHVTEMSPFILAVIEFLPEFVVLFLKFGARVGDQCLNPRSKYYMLCAMDAAFKVLREKILWKPAQSVFGLIFAISELKQVCCTIGHLIRASPAENIRKDVYRYAEEGKIVELTALLYIDTISGFRIIKKLSSVECDALRQYVSSSILSRSDEEACLVVIDGGNPVFVNKKLVMMSVDLLLKIFYRTNFSDLGFNTSREILVTRMKAAGFSCTDDHLKYFYE